MAGIFGWNRTAKNSDLALKFVDSHLRLANALDAVLTDLKTRNEVDPDHWRTAKSALYYADKLLAKEGSAR